MIIIIFIYTVFNWKQKAQLRFDGTRNKKVVTIKSFGNFDDIKDLINTDDGDQIYDLSDLQNFQEPIRKVTTNAVNVHKVIDISALYGSHKSYGFIKKEFKENVNKSFTRVRMSRGRPQ